jgi:hypothetical protein
VRGVEGGGGWTEMRYSLCALQYKKKQCKAQLCERATTDPDMCHEDC